MTRAEPSDDRPSRRTFTKTTAAGLLVLFQGCFDDESNATEEPGRGVGQDPDGEPDRIFEFEGAMGGWQALAPSDIEDETNPTLTLDPGETYEFRWTNGDGFEHNFVLLDGNGDELIRTGIVDRAGQTQTIKFTATEEMYQYICEVHPATMRGGIEIAGREEQPTPYEEDSVFSPSESVGLETAADGLAAPLAFETAPGLDDRQFVVDQPGQIYVLEADGVREEPFLDIGDRIVDLGDPEVGGYDERGLLGLAFHPEFEENQRFFVRYSAPHREGTPEEFDHTDVLAEFEADEDLERGDPDSERTLWEIPSPQMNHNAGAIAFGPDDGYLYTSIGDGGDADDTGRGHVDDWNEVNDGGNGQDTTENLLGGIHRLDVDADGEGDRAYGIPEDNPFVGSDEGLDEYYAWGFRNNFKLSFDSEARLFVSDAGQNRFESVYLVEKGGNYGWNVTEGTHSFSTERPTASPDELSDSPATTPDDVRGGEELRDPIIEYTHRYRTTAPVDGSVVIGGHVYEGDAVDLLRDRYVFGNWSSRGLVESDGQILVATEPESDDGELWSLEQLAVEGSPNGKLNRYVYGFGRDQDDELYILTSANFRPEGSTGEVHRIVPAGEGNPLSKPESPDVEIPDDGTLDGASGDE